MSDIVASLKRRLLRRKVHVETVIQLCTKMDKKRAGILHMDDIKSIFLELLADDCPSRREMQALEGLLKVDANGDVNYLILEDLLHDEYRPKSIKWSEDEKGDDEEEEEYARGRSRPGQSKDVKTTKEESMKLPSGSIGEWLQRAACPIEVQNYQKFINVLEEFEKDTGVQISTNKDGMVVPLGPNLRASVNFFVI